MRARQMTLRAPGGIQGLPRSLQALAEERVLDRRGRHQVHGEPQQALQRLAQPEVRREDPNPRFRHLPVVDFVTASGSGFASSRPSAAPVVSLALAALGLRLRR